MGHVRVLRPERGAGGPHWPPTESGDVVGPAIFMAGSFYGTWRETLVEMLEKFVPPACELCVIDPINLSYPDFTPAGHRQQVSWEQHWLDHAEITPVFWFPKEAPGSCSLFELGTLLGYGAPKRSLFVGFEDGCVLRKEIAARTQLMAERSNTTAVIFDSLAGLAEAAVAAVCGGPAQAGQSHLKWTTTASLHVPETDDACELAPKKQKAGVDYVGVGCGGFIFDKDRRVLLIKRSSKARSEPGTWARPGGAVELGETAEDCLRREMLEEVGMHVDTCTVLDVTTQLDPHWVAIGYLCTSSDPPSAAVNKEPHKHDDLQWFHLDQLPSPLAAFVVDILAQIRADPDKYLPPVGEQPGKKKRA